MVTSASLADDWDDVYNSVLADPAGTENQTCAPTSAPPPACGPTMALTRRSSPPAARRTTSTSTRSGPARAAPAGSGPTRRRHPSDELLDAFAVKDDSGDDQPPFFGADRWSTNGAKDMGFWFFHDTVSLNANGTFSGVHTRPTAGLDGIPGNTDDTRGDILLLSTFTQGGAVTSIRVFEWVGVGGNTNGTLNSIGAFGDPRAREPHP